MTDPKTAKRGGPLAGLRVVEMQGLGPCPLAGQFLADMGAEVTLITRASGPEDATNINNRGKASIALNLKHPEGLKAAKALIARSDVLIEGFRPGVMERMGLGPVDCHADNPGLVYGRMTGWGQDGPMSQMAGHDINYLGLTGVLNAIGTADQPPIPPLNIAADYGGGTMFLLFGVLSALFERQTSGKGQIVDAAMVDGVPAMMALMHSMIARGRWGEDRQSNWLDGGAPFYRSYECADGNFVSIGSIEPQFYAVLREKMELTDPAWDQQMSRSAWPELKAELTARFKEKTRDEWCEIMEHTDICFAPVLSMAEAPQHPHNIARGTFVERNGVTQPRPAPRFSRTDSEIQRPPAHAGQHTDELLADLGYSAEEIAALREAGSVA